MFTFVNFLHVFRLLEINGMSVSGQTQREINTLLKKQTQEGGALRVVAARPVDGRSEEANRLLNQSQCNTCVYIYTCTQPLVLLSQL